MKILAIRGSNLASLAGDFKLQLDEGALARAGLFAITGPTGAGKSTLLDAMCLALFAKTPRLKDRGGAEIGAEAEEHKLTANDARNLVRRGTSLGWAEVEFLGQDDRRYRARWTVRRARNRVEGKFQNEEWTLSEVDSDRTLGGSGKEETRRAIEAKLGLTYEQFRRSAMLAQGDFAAFLKAPADERAELLERVTGTKIYTDISIAAHKKNAECALRLRDHQSLMGGVKLLEVAEREALGVQATAQDGVTKQSEASCRTLEEAQRWHVELAKIQLQAQEAVQQLEAARLRVAETAELADKLVAVRAAQAHRVAVDNHDRLERERAETSLALDATLAKLKGTELALAEANGALDGAKAVAIEADKRLVLAKPQLEEARRLDVLLEATRQRATESKQAADKARKEAKRQQDLASKRARQLADTQSALTNAQAWLADRKELAPLVQKQGRWMKSVEDFAKLHGGQGDRLKELKKLEKLEAKLIAALEKSKAKEQALRHDLSLLDGELGSARATDPSREREALRATRLELGDRRESLAAIIGLAREARGLDQEAVQLTAANERSLAEVRAAQARQESAAKELITLGLQLEEAQRALEQFSATRDLAAWRVTLVDGEECPLCGALEHPYSHKAPASKVQTAQAKRVKALEEQRLSRASLEAASRSQAEQGQAAIAGARERLDAIAKALKANQPKWKKASAQRPELALPAKAQDADLGALEGQQTAIAKDFEAIDHLERGLQAIEAKLKGLQQRRDEGQQALEVATKARTDDERKAEVARRDKAELARSNDQSEARLEQLLAELQKAFVKRPAWVVSLQADPGKFLRQAVTEVSEWERFSAEAAELAGKSKTEAVEAKSATKMFEAAEKLAAEAGAIARTHDVELEKLLSQRGQLLEGQEAAAFEKSLLEAAKKAGTALERLNLAATKASSEVAAAKAIRATTEASLAKAHAACEAQVSRLEAALKDAQLDLLTLRALLAYEAEWVTEREHFCQEALRAVTIAEATLQERQSLCEAHEASVKPAASASELELQLVEARARLERCREELGETRRQLSNDDESRIAHAQHLAELEQLREEVRPWEDLHKVIGSADGKAFRMFAQGLTLGMLLELANEHLKELAPRYRLLKVPSQDLEIQVKDLDMGEEIRGPQSLSGGETFLVSLALALGLSSFAAKNTRIRSLFIDEGFGSLDAQTLEVALASLDALQATGRQVGIISHVPGLGDRLGVQVAIEPMGGGRSALRIRSGASEELVALVPKAKLTKSNSCLTP